MAQPFRSPGQNAASPTVRLAGERWVPVKVAAIYLGFSILWIALATFGLRAVVGDQALLRRLEVYAGWAFVVVSAGLLALLAHGYLRRIERARQRISTSEARYRQLIDTAPEAIVVMDMEHGRFVEYNSAAERLFGMSGAELVRHGPVELSPEFQPDGQRSVTKAAAYLKQAMDGSSPVFEWVHRGRNRIDVPCEIQLLLLPSDGAPLIRGSITNITERLRAQQAVRESEQQLTLIFNNATDMMALFSVEADGVFRVVSVNKTYLTVVNAAGYPVELADLIGRTVDEVNDRPYRFPPEFMRNLSDRLHAVVKSRENVSFEEAYDTPAGRYFGETVLTPVVDGTGRCTFVLYCSRDVTGPRRAATALAHSEDNYRTLFEQATDAIFLVGPDSRMVDVNQRTTQLTGYSREELLQKTTFDVIAAEDHDYLRFCLKELMLQGSRFSTYRFRRKDGSVFSGETNTKLLRDGRLLAMVRDITERKTAEEQRARLERELRQAQKMQAIGTLAGGIAHDFNNILAAILGNAQLLKLLLAPAHEGHGNVSQILVASHRAKDLVQQILMFSRQREQLRQVLRLEPLLKEAVKLVSVSISPLVKLELNLAPDVPAVLADPTQIHQVVVNLCTNALHAMRETGGTLEVSLATVSMPEETTQSKPDLPTGRYVRLAIRDTGHGMDASTLERIYEPFFTTKPVGEGTGLGLAVVHGIVQSSDGAISVTSAPGLGTTFKIYLPAVDARAGSEPKPVPGLKKGGGQHIVFVDDEVSIAEVAKIMLAKLGYRVTAFIDPREALDYLQADSEHVSLLMTDLSMPGLSGVNLIRDAMRIMPDLRAILLTGYGKSFDSKSAVGLNISEVIHKPFTMEQLSTAIELALSPHEPELQP